MSRRVLEVANLSVLYESGSSRRLALDDVSVEVDEGEIVGIVGESGCGKSTLGLSVMGLLPPSARVAGGTVSLNGRDLATLSAEELRDVRGKEIAMIFQDPTSSLNPRLPIGAQLAQVLKAHHALSRGSKRALRSAIVDKLDEVGMPDPDRALYRYPYEFSGGMRQRVMIAMALLLEPSVIVADEATSALDVTLEAQILEILLRLREKHGTAIVYVSHDLGVVAQLCDRIAVMYAGRVVEQVSGGGEFFSRARHPYSQALEAAIPRLRDRGRRCATIAGRVPDLTLPATLCTFAPRCPRSRPLCSEERPGDYPYDGGVVSCWAYSHTHAAEWREPPSVADWSSSERADVTSSVTKRDEGNLLEIRDLSVHFVSGVRLPLVGRPSRVVRAVDRATLTLGRGRILGIVGESGSGKSTLAEAVMKLRSPTSGTLAFAGEDVTRPSSRATREFRRRVQMIFQSPHTSLSPRMKIGSILTEPYQIYRVPRSERKSLGELLEAVGLPDGVTNVYPNQVSGGQARRVGIARALAYSPDLLVADEPTAGLDASSAGAIVNLLADLRRDHGISIIMISHNLSVVSTLADEVCVMYFGQIVERGSVGEVMSAPAHPYTKALLALAAATDAESRTERRELLVPGEIPSPDAPPSGCKFHPRCRFSQDICHQVEPALEAVGEGSQMASCHFAREVRTEVSVGVRGRKVT